MAESRAFCRRDRQNFAEARGASVVQDSDTTGDLEAAIVDTRIAKYAFIANLKVLQTGDELTKLGQKR